MSVIHTPRRPTLDLRLALFPGIMAALLGIIFFRLWFFQVVKSPELMERADATRLARVYFAAPRGDIFDRNGELVAGLKPQIVITGIYSVLKKNPDVVDRLAQILQVDRSKLDPKIDKARSSPGLPAPIYVGATEAAGTKVAEAGDELPGIGVELAPMRFYPDTSSFTHVLGYMRQPNRRDMDRIGEDLKKENSPVTTPAEFVGAKGVERAYETALMGVPGEEVNEVDAKRRPLRIVDRQSPIPGKQLVLSLDAKLQRLATHEMASKTLSAE